MFEMNWQRLLCAKRKREPYAVNPSDIRSEFRKDYHRIIGSASFRRLQDKTQVYPLGRGDFVRTRLTHSLEVSSFAGSLADTIFTRLTPRGTPGVDHDVRESCCDILECAGLVHDIGNPPLGHFGEYAIREWFAHNFPLLSFEGKSVDTLLSPQMRADFLNFEGNAQALRVLTRLHCLMDMSTGMNLTYALLCTIIKYPVSSLGIDKSGGIKGKKMGFYASESDIFRDITESCGTISADGEVCRSPLTFILESADDIAYKTADIEDAVIKRLISYHQLAEELTRFAFDCRTDAERELLSRASDELERSHAHAGELGMLSPDEKAVQRWIIKVQAMLLSAAADAFCEHYDEIMRGEFDAELLTASPARVLANALSDIARRYAFESVSKRKTEIASDTMLTTLLDRTVGAALRFDTSEERGSDKRLLDAIAGDLREVCRRDCEGAPLSEQVYRRLLLATDSISSMTDGGALEIYRVVTGMMAL